MNNKNIDFYNSHAKDLFNQYQSIAFEKAHSNWIHLIKNADGKKALDIGAGSGRDAKALTKLGFNVTAVEPAQELSALGSKFCEDKVQWLNDKLPLLSSLAQQQFDLILVSAVWMHLSPELQKLSMERIFSLLTNSGILVLTLRYGGFEDTRSSEAIDELETLQFARQLGLTCILNNRESDKLNRGDISWQTLVLLKQEN